MKINIDNPPFVWEVVIGKSHPNCYTFTAYIPSLGVVPTTINRQEINSVRVDAKFNDGRWNSVDCHIHRVDGQETTRNLNSMMHDLGHDICKMATIQCPSWKNEVEIEWFDSEINSKRSSITRLQNEIETLMQRKDQFITQEISERLKVLGE